MNQKSITYKRSLFAKISTLVLILAMLALALPVTTAFAAPLAAAAADGEGAMAVSPTSVVYGSSTAFTFTFSPTVGDYVAGSSVTLAIPAGWSTPTALAGAGHVVVNPGSCAINGSAIAGSVITVDLDGCLVGQSFSISYTGAPAAVVGSPYSFITQTDVPGGNGFFNVAVLPTVDVTKKALTVTGITAADMVYGSGSSTTLNTGSAALVGIVGSDAVSFASLPTTGSFTAPYSVGNNKPLTLAVIGLAGLDSGNYTLTQPAVTANITPKQLTITGTTASNKVYDGGTSASLVTTSSALVGNLDGPTVVLVKTGATGTFTLDGNVGTGKSVQASGFTITGSAIGNYTLTQPTMTANITAKPITVTPDAGQKKVFGDVEPGYTYTHTALVGLDAITGTLARAAGENAGTYAFNLGTLDAGSNYSLSLAAENFSITAKPLTVTVDAGQSKVFGAADPSFSYVSSIPAAVFTGALDRAAGENVGTYAIGLGTLSAGGNYSITLVGANFEITPKPVTITVDAAQTKVFGAVDPTFTYISSDPAATFTGALVRIAGEDVGTYAIGQGTLASTNYSIGSFVAADFSITTKPITVTATAGQHKAANTADPVFAYTHTAMVGTDALSGALSRDPGEAVGFYAITQGTLSASTNYTIIFVSAQFEIKVASVFDDVPQGSFAWNFINALYNSGITGGCSVTPMLYCPNASVTRAQMAVFLIKAKGISPVPATGTMFTDVPDTAFAAKWIEELARQGITSGCGNNNFCPNAPVTRDQMAVFLLKAMGVTPAPATGTMFTDVPDTAFAAKWIEELARRGITSGCGNNNFCPGNPITRAQMAVFLVKAFALPLP